MDDTASAPDAYFGDRSKLMGMILVYEAALNDAVRLEPHVVHLSDRFDDIRRSARANVGFENDGSLNAIEQVIHALEVRAASPGAPAGMLGEFDPTGDPRLAISWMLGRMRGSEAALAIVVQKHARLPELRARIDGIRRVLAILLADAKNEGEAWEGVEIAIGEFEGMLDRALSLTLH